MNSELLLQGEVISPEELLRDHMNDSAVEKVRKPRKTRRKVRKNNSTKRPKGKIKKVFTDFKCTICKKEFAAKYYLETHMQIHRKDKLFACDQCTYKGKTSKYLYRHKKVCHSDEKPKHKCEQCEKLFTSKEKLTIHLRLHTGEKPYKCKECNKTFRHRYSLTTHIYIHTGEKPFECSFCPYSCRDSSTLRKHQNRHMGLQKIYQCNSCPRSCKSKWQLKAHVAQDHLCIDLKHFQCDICKKSFTLKKQLSNHIQFVHERVNTCKCEICGYILSNKNNLPAHMRSHLDMRPYRCTFPGCTNTYKEHTSLKKHKVTHSPEQWFPCRLCGKRFSRRARRDRHLELHARTKDVQCGRCGDKFYSTNYLEKHMRSKHNKKRQRYICDICGLKTYNKPSIVMHLKYGHDEAMKNRQCEFCKKKFKEYAYLKGHYWIVHNIRLKPNKLTLIRKKKKKGGIYGFKVKEEPQDYEEEECSEELQPGYDPSTQDEAKIIKDNKTELRKVPENVFDCYMRTVLKPDEVAGKNTDHIHFETAEHAKKSVKRLLAASRQKMLARVLERARRQYNKRMDEFHDKLNKKEQVKIKYFNKKHNESSQNNNNVLTEAQNDVNETASDNNETHDTIATNESNVASNENENNVAARDKNDVNDRNESNVVSSNKNGLTTSGESDKSDHYDDRTTNNDNSERGKGATRKIKLNSHQCYVCFKLFDTKENLLDHCKEHFDLCSEKALKKCPFCEYVTNKSVTRHIRHKHKITIRVPYGKVKEKSNATGSRYSYDLKECGINDLEIIPSVKYLNKAASMDIDKKNRTKKNKVIETTKLVKKGNSWVVENQKLRIKDYTLPKIQEKDLKYIKHNSETYLDKLKCLHTVAKRNGIKMMFPCKKCEKICSTAAALKLHLRKHESNPKPFKPKVWKHKLKEPVQTTKTQRKVKISTDNRTANPKPIVNKHRCDENLKQFYEDNIKGSDIDFNQFLRIYNKIEKENVQEFDDLQSNPAFGVHVEPNLTNKELGCIKKSSKSKNMAKVSNSKAFKRIVRITKAEKKRREEIKRKLRENIARNNNLN